jgi:hypothetical protein
MNVARINHTATLLSNGEVLVAGGNNSTDGYLSSAEVYHPSSGKWTLTGSMTVPRDGHDAVLLQNGEVLVAGGNRCEHQRLHHFSYCRAVQPVNRHLDGDWQHERRPLLVLPLRCFPMERCSPAGGTNCGNGGLLSAELYNPATRTWRATGTMTSGNQNTGAVLLQNGQVFVVGNDDIYNPSAGAWSSTTPPPTFAHIPLALLPNGDVFAAGTIQGDLMFNPSTAQWTTFAPPPCETTKQGCESAAALLNTGKVLVAGGATFVNARPYPIEQTNALAALFDPSTLIWTSTGSMSKSRLGESMTVLLNGQALVAGGDTFDSTWGIFCRLQAPNSTRRSTMDCLHAVDCWERLQGRSQMSSTFVASSTAAKRI